MKSNSTIGQRIIAAREKIGLSHADLWRNAGIHPGQLGKYERDIAVPNLANLERLATALKTSTDSLLGRDGKERK